MVGGNAAAAVVRTDHTPTAARAVGGAIAQPALLEVDEGRQLASKLIAHRPPDLLSALGRLEHRFGVARLEAHGTVPLAEEALGLVGALEGFQEPHLGRGRGLFL